MLGTLQEGCSEEEVSVATRLLLEVPPFPPGAGGAFPGLPGPCARGEAVLVRKPSLLLNHRPSPPHRKLQSPGEEHRRARAPAVLQVPAVQSLPGHQRLQTASLWPSPALSPSRLVRTMLHEMQLFAGVSGEDAWTTTRSAHVQGLHGPLQPSGAAGLRSVPVRSRPLGWEALVSLLHFSPPPPLRLQEEKPEPGRAPEREGSRGSSAEREHAFNSPSCFSFRCSQKSLRRRRSGAAVWTGAM